MRTIAQMICLGLVIARVAGAGMDDFPAPYNSEQDPGHPLPPAEAARALSLPKGFRAQVFAAEPDVRNPIALAWDHKGRLWIAENYTYAERGLKFDLRLRDRVLIFEDSDGDGKPDQRRVFTDNIQKLTSVAVGRGGAWLLCPPQLIFVPDRDGNDVPDGPATVILDGFTIPPENYHNLVNGLKWGPDGWLYGRCGASAPGRVGAPGTPEAKRIPLNGGLWRYHPTRGTFEVIAHGTTNPWGHDWNSLGEAFFINTVNGHLWHAVAGMHFLRPHTLDPNPGVYIPIDQHADHWHWDNSKDWSDSRKVTGEHDRRGGGHAHSGLMIYQGEQWPEVYRNKLFTLNLHGRRVNVDRLERLGNGYVGRHEPDFLRSGDPWFRGIELSQGPDGSVYVLDWSDAGECHESTGVHRTSGRIFKITYGDPKPFAPRDFSRETSRRLADLSVDGDEEAVRQARMLLSERAANADLKQEISAILRGRLSKPDDIKRSLRSLWSLNAVDGLDEALLLDLLKHPHEAMRVWSIRLLSDTWPLDDILSHRTAEGGSPSPRVMERLLELARSDSSGLVRLVLASTLQRLAVEQRIKLARELLSHAEDSLDHNQSLLIWFGLIPVAKTHSLELARLAVEAKQPLVQRLVARNLIESVESRPEPVALLNQALIDGNRVFREEVLRGFTEGLRGIRKVSKPANWDVVQAKLGGEPGLSGLLRELSVVFGDGRALDEVRALALDEKAPLDVRKSALQSLIENRPEDLRSICERLLKVRFLNAIAVRGLSLYNDPAIGRELVASYRSFHPSERPAVLDTLVSRPTYALALLEGVAQGKVARSELSAFQARQIRSLNDPLLNAKLSEVWGEFRDSAPERLAAIRSWKNRISAKASTTADQSRGRAVFAKICGSCHQLYGHGGQIGPDLTGAGRDQIDYLLENILDPSATVTTDYRMTVLAMKDGRVLNGIIKSKNERVLNLQTQNEVLPIDLQDIEATKPTTASLMPDGLLDSLRPEEVEDLFSYLMGRVQVPLPSAP